MYEQRKRSFLKALSWRFVATLTTVLIVYAYTREAFVSLGIGVVEFSLKMALYYGHERLWSRIGWATAEGGRQSPETNDGALSQAADVAAQSRCSR